ncbi:hypothetical protein CONPUDRAFT_140086 [Coniophora puteana RWD-64-598 SS2]|uniref:t-SNARE coiled-coil homology domain-containing protein n=1 Tax=Coniophora puteana (strain RWD-64-598) TaxID=741705 RepID=A0A5M3M907_CONPW|nr:uncharacterized protein CONPUDRAFT_140086 [Coniophora puteana RWD-64-598 SS2]EIW75752.1 hypothetical protein CONPUDRAFT_140086 [Coniophora puteana RWD-64-598 SS2]
MSNARLSALATQTLTLLFERSRMQSLSPEPSQLHLPQITANLETLRTAVLASPPYAAETEDLRVQYERLLDMLGEAEAQKAGLERIPPPREPTPPPQPLSPSPTPSSDTPYEPYTDDPGVSDHGILLQQHEMMSDQDTRLDVLSSSIGRQHHLSLQINDELDTHSGLLDTLDTDLDSTHDRMTSARRRLDRVARGAKANGSSVTIALLIVVLLILIVVFKT